MHAETGLLWLVAWFGFSLLLATDLAQAAGIAIYVSPHGDDSWSGSLSEPNRRKTDGPVATPRKALDLVRRSRSSPGNAGQPITVYLRGGTYFLKQPLTFTPPDSGSQKGPVIWCAYQGERPVLSGGQRITNWTQTTVNGHDAWMARLPDEDGIIFRELWCDGKRLIRARWPHKGTLAVAGLSDGEKHDDWTCGQNQFRYAEGDLLAWPTARDGEAIVANRWVESHLPIVSIDEKEHVIHFGKRSVFLLEPGDRYWIENVRECLTEPGEFYVDPSRKIVYLIPPADVDPNEAEVVAPRLAQVLRLLGDPAAGKFVEHITFRGIGFAHTEWYFDHSLVARETAACQAGSEEGLKPDPIRSGFPQAAIGVPGAIGGVGVRSCLFEACEVSHIGNYGIELARGCRANKIIRCTLTDLGAGGVKIGETTVRDVKDEQTFGNGISDCTIADGGNLFPGCVAVWIGQSHDNLVAHNDIHGFWYTAVSVGWTWGYGRSAAQRNIVEYNHIHHIGIKSDGEQPILSDMGCIYTLGDEDGTVVRFNRVHDVAARKYGGWGIYFDEGTTHILAENNLVYRTTHGGFHQHYGRENIFRNNIIAYGRDAQIQRTRVEDHLSFTFERNVVLWDKGPLLAGDWSKPNAAFDHNTYWNGGREEIRWGDRTWQQWRQAGMDEHSRIADPGFVDPVHGNFALKPASEAALAGFRPFDVSTAGPRRP